MRSGEQRSIASEKAKKARNGSAEQRIAEELKEEDISKRNCCEEENDEEEEMRRETKAVNKGGTAPHLVAGVVRGLGRLRGEELLGVLRPVRGRSRGVRRHVLGRFHSLLGGLHRVRGHVKDVLDGLLGRLSLRAFNESETDQQTKRTEECTEE